MKVIILGMLLLQTKLLLKMQIYRRIYEITATADPDTNTMSHSVIWHCGRWKCLAMDYNISMSYQDQISTINTYTATINSTNIMMQQELEFRYLISYYRNFLVVEVDLNLEIPVLQEQPNTEQAAIYRCYRIHSNR